MNFIAYGIVLIALCTILKWLWCLFAAEKGKTNMNFIERLSSQEAFIVGFSLAIALTLIVILALSYWSMSAMLKGKENHDENLTSTQSCFETTRNTVALFDAECEYPTTLLNPLYSALLSISGPADDFCNVAWTGVKQNTFNRELVPELPKF